MSILQLHVPNQHHHAHASKHANAPQISVPVLHVPLNNRHSVLVLRHANAHRVNADVNHAQQMNHPQIVFVQRPSAPVKVNASVKIANSKIVIALRHLLYVHVKYA